MFDLESSYETYVYHFCNLMKEFQAENVILKVKLYEVKEINGFWNEREDEKHIVLKNTLIALTEEVEKVF